MKRVGSCVRHSEKSSGKQLTSGWAGEPQRNRWKSDSGTEVTLANQQRDMENGVAYILGTVLFWCGGTLPLYRVK